MKIESLISKVSEKSKVRTKDIKKVIKFLIETVGESIRNGEKVTLTGLGTFRVKERKAKPARNLQTGETVYLPKGEKISFKPSISFKQYLKNPSGQP